VNVTGKALTLTVSFGIETTLAFNQTVGKGWPGLPNGTSWSVTLTSKGGPGKPSVTVATKTNLTNFLSPTGHQVSFTVVKGVTYTWLVTTPTGYEASGGKGTVTGGAKNVTKAVKFKLYTSTVAFTEHGLPAETVWSVYVNLTTSPFTSTLLTGSTRTLKAYLTNGTYSYVVPNAAGDTPKPANGVLTITAPHGRAVGILFKAPTHPLGPGSKRLADLVASQSRLVAADRRGS
jgi:hypothetical protein